jgi:hypothetical protein
MEAEWSSSSNTRNSYRVGHVVPKQSSLISPSDEVRLPGLEEMDCSLLPNLFIAFVLNQALPDP